MMNISTLVLTILVLAFIILAIWNGINFNALRKKAGVSSEQLNDSKCFELKYKQEFFIAIVSFITALAVFIGYGSIDSIQTKMKDEIETNLQANILKIDSLKAVIKKSDSALSSIQNATNQYSQLAIQNQIKQQRLLSSLSSSETKTNDFQKRIDELNKKNILKQELYIVKDIEFDVSKETGINNSNITEYYFSQLKTVLNEPLPSFKKPPVNVTTSNSGASLYIYDVTTSSFKMGSSAYLTLENSSNPPKSQIVKVNLLISEIPE